MLGARVDALGNCRSRPWFGPGNSRGKRARQRRVRRPRRVLAVVAPPVLIKSSLQGYWQGVWRECPRRTPATGRPPCIRPPLAAEVCVSLATPPRPAAVTQTSARGRAVPGQPGEPYTWGERAAYRPSFNEVCVSVVHPQAGSLIAVPRRSGPTPGAREPRGPDERAQPRSPATGQRGRSPPPRPRERAFHSDRGANAPLARPEGLRPGTRPWSGPVQ